MKTRLVAVQGLLFAVIVFAIACKKSTTTPDSETDPPVELWPDSSKVAFPKNAIPPCPNGPKYVDTLICNHPVAGQDYVISPVNNPGTGKYYSWPVGLNIDSTNGAINVTKSEPGLRYMIGFVKNGTSDTCLSELVISGTSYRDSVHVLSDGEKYAALYSDASVVKVPNCGGGNCDFDITNEANGKKIKVDKKTGKIDLEKTLQQGAFGLLSMDGDVVEATISYKLNDGCNTSVQRMKVYLMFYTYKSQISPTLLSTLALKGFNLLNGDILSTSSNPRPPLIIITRYR